MSTRIDLQGPWRAIVRAPMVRLAIPLVGGVALAKWLAPPLVVLVSLMAVLTPLMVFLLLRKAQNERRWEQGTILLVWFLCFGMLWQVLRDPRSLPEHVENSADHEGPWLVRVVAINGTSDRTVRADALVEAQWRDGEALPCKGTVMLTVLQGSESRTVEVGNRLWVDASLTPIARVPDPGGFDRRRWAASRGIALEAFAPSDDWHIVGHTGHWTDPFTGARQAVAEWLAGSDLPVQERALVKALVLGQRDELDGEQRKSFARSGTIHVLAVSGMHVGLIFAILTFVFGWLGNGERGRILRGVFVLLALWGYAGLTGGSPSVLRATLMFSLFTLANMYEQRTDHLNSLFAAAFVLVLWDPDMLWRIGFQLSFLAVLGIILFYKPIEGLWAPGNKVFRAIWSLAVVSMSAQMLTTPVSLYLFQAFPVWFLPANIIVVTAVGLAVNGAVALLLLYKVPYIGVAITWGMTILLKCVGWVTGFFAGLPGAYPDIRIGVWDMLFLYLAILAFVAWWQWRWGSMRWVATCGVLLLLGSWGLRASTSNERSQLVIYDERDGVKAAICEGRSWVLLCDPETYSSDTWTQRKIEAHRKAMGLSEPLLLQPDSLGSTGAKQYGITLAGADRWRSRDFDVAFLSDVDHWPDSIAGAPFDALVLHDLKYLPDERLAQLSRQTRCLVLAGGLSWKVRNRVQEYCGEHSIEVHDIRSQGAFIRTR